MITRTGPALRLLPRLGRIICDPADLLAAALRLCAEGRPGLHLSIVEDSRGPALVVEEAERTARAELSELAVDIARTQLDLGPAGLDAALDRWVGLRPVTDAEAARRGIAILSWSDPTETALAWQVTVHRRGVVVGWVPYPFTGAGDVLAIRSAAQHRAADVVVQCSVEGPVLLLDADEPLLATAACSAPERVLAAAAQCGLQLSGAYVVVTPGRPVAWAQPLVAARLAGETVEPCVVLPWRALRDLPWV